jgi:hypothetical protein
MLTINVIDMTLKQKKSSHLLLAEKMFDQVCNAEISF